MAEGVLRIVLDNELPGPSLYTSGDYKRNDEAEITFNTHSW
jgi:hypothetical protein